MTEIFTYLRVFYAQFGERECPGCHHPIKPRFTEADGMDDSHATLCPQCGMAQEKLTMASFSFNKPEGSCETCSGLGVANDLDLSTFVNEDLSLEEGAVKIGKGVIADHYKKVMDNAGKHYGFNCDASKRYETTVRSNDLSSFTV